MYEHTVKPLASLLRFPGARPNKLNEEINMNEGLNTQAGSGQVKPRDEKHVEIRQSVKELNEVKNRIENLIQRIEGPRPVDVVEENAKEPPATLVEVLSETPAKIRAFNDDAIERLSYLEGILF